MDTQYVYIQQVDWWYFQMRKNRIDMKNGKDEKMQNIVVRKCLGYRSATTPS